MRIFSKNLSAPCSPSVTLHETSAALPEVLLRVLRVPAIACTTAENSLGSTFLKVSAGATYHGRARLAQPSLIGLLLAACSRERAYGVRVVTLFSVACAPSAAGASTRRAAQRALFVYTLRDSALTASVKHGHAEASW